MRPADRAIRILAELQLAELHPQRIEDQESTDQWFANPENQFQRFVRLNAADDARQDTEDAALGTARDQPRRRRLRIQAAVARTLLRTEDRRLSFESEDTAVRVRFSEQHAGVVHQIPSGKVIGAIENDVAVVE